MPEVLKVVIGVDEEGKPNVAEYSIDIGDNLDTAISRFGDDKVYAAYRAGILQDMRLRMKAGLKKGKSFEEMVAELQTWDLSKRPKIQKKTPFEKAVTVINHVQVGALTEEEKAKLRSLLL